VVVDRWLIRSGVITKYAANFKFSDAQKSKNSDGFIFFVMMLSQA
jgi:hypothetical protein